MNAARDVDAGDGSRTVVGAVFVGPRQDTVVFLGIVQAIGHVQVRVLGAQRGDDAAQLSQLPEGVLS